MTGSAILNSDQDVLCVETSEQRSKGSQEASYVGIQEKSIPGIGNGKHKGSTMGMGQPTSEQHREECGQSA